MTLTTEDFKRLDDRYVTKADCERRNDKTQEDIASMKADLRELVARNALTNRLLGLVAGSVIAGIISLAISRIF